MSRTRNLLADGLDWVAIKIWGLAHWLRPVVAATNEPRAPSEYRTFGLAVHVLVRAPSMKDADDLFIDRVVEQLPDDERVWVVGWTTSEEPEEEEGGIDVTGD